MEKEIKLKVNNLKISFRTDAGKVQAVRNIDFELYKGETLAIVGESGSGKSVTNRAIIGILANNAIVESGEILYDGKDLLKIDEEDFHKIRGDKISMIFQDPMSSLNPIMKIGKQLTEAMILNGKSSQRNARVLFNSTLKYLNDYMDLVATSDEEKKANKARCDEFNEFCVNSCHLEKRYNAIYREAQELKEDIDNTLFLLERKQTVDMKRFIVTVLDRIKETYHPDIVVLNDELKSVLEYLEAEKAKKEKSKEIGQESLKALAELSAILDKATKRPKPNYFTLGFYMMKNPDANLDDMPIDELTQMTREYLDKEFMLDFIAKGAKALQKARRLSLNAKSELVGKIDNALKFFNGSDFTKADALKIANELADGVEKAINKLEIVKNSTEYTFRSSINVAVKKYFDAIAFNPKEQARYDRQKAKYDKLVASGKKIDWKIVPAAIVDLDIPMGEIKHILENLKENYEKQLAVESFDYETGMVAIIDFLKEQASLFVYKVTQKIAKARALKLMEEVGIPEARIRYNQYPFEFSGGMRQRIVIAIALAANPDILICDEPTTALDVTIQAQILELINRIKKERNLSVIFITHDLGVVANMADRIAVMYAGKIVEIGTADDVFYNPRHPYTWALLSSMPDLDTNEKLDAIPGTPPNMIYPPKGDAFAARNKYAMQIDFEEQPPMFKISDTHYAATWLLHPNAPKVDIPEVITSRIERMKKKMTAQSTDTKNVGGVDNEQ